MSKPADRATTEWTIAVAITYSLILAAGAGYVFCCSIWPVSIAEGYGAVLANYPWVFAFLVLAAAWVIGPLLSLVLGLVAMRQGARFTWRLAVGWLCALAGSTAAGFAVLRDFQLLFTAYHTDLDGSPLGSLPLRPWRAVLAGPPRGGRPVRGMRRADCPGQEPMVGLATAAVLTNPTAPRSSWMTHWPTATPCSLTCPQGCIPTCSPCGSRPR